MEKKYKKIEFGLGTIDSAIEQLKSHEGLVCGSFNGKILYSDVDDIDSAYKKITGKTKSEFDEEQKKDSDRYARELREHEENIPNLELEWIEKGNSILDEKYHEKWAECVPIRLSDLYRGMELEACLEIVKELNDGCEMEKAKEIIYSQGHSGMSASLVRSMVMAFCDRGEEFFKYTKW